MKIKLKEYVAVSDSGVIFNAQTGESFSVNEMGMIILDHIKLNQDKAQIKYSILSEFDIDEKSLDTHIDEFILFLKRFRLIELLPIP